MARSAPRLQGAVRAADGLLPESGGSTPSTPCGRATNLRRRTLTERPEPGARPAAPASEKEVTPLPIADSVRLGRNVTIHHPGLVNLYGCTVGDDTRIGAFVEIQKNATIGARCKISSHTFVCEGVTIEDEVFVGHGVMFTNDRFPRATTAAGVPQGEADWTVEETRIRRRASIGSNATIVSGIVIGEGALVGAGAVVTRDVPDFAIVTGVPARVTGDTRECK
jgi:acetyltransferase-like isoleucine patch superfamily enzyme